MENVQINIRSLCILLNVSKCLCISLHSISLKQSRAEIHEMLLKDEESSFEQSVSMTFATLVGAWELVYKMMQHACDGALFVQLHAYTIYALLECAS